MTADAEDRLAGPRGRTTLVTSLLVAGIVLLAMSLRAPYTGVGALLPRIRDDYALTAVAAGVLASLPLLAFGLVSPLAVPISRRLGMERTLFVVLVVIAAGVALRFLPQAWALFVGTAMLGGAIAVANVLLPSLVKRDFPGHVTTVTSLYVTGMSFLGALAAGVAVPIADVAPGGWRTSIGCWGILTVIALAVWAPQLARATATAIAERRAAEAAPAGPPVWRSLTAWKVTAYMGLQSFSFYVVISWEPTVLLQYGVSAEDAGWLIFILQGLGLPAGFMVPLFVRYLGSPRLLAVLCSLGVLIGYTGLALWPRLALLWVIVVGPCSGGCFMLALAFLSLRAGGAREAAALSGMAQSLGYLLAGAGPVLFGLLHDMTGAWVASFVLLLVMTALQCVAAYAAGGPGEVGRS
ncbi:MAG TPA: MFS transporter [Hyphomicrobiales bacterium]|nr:MFS transporter [Hyphomicrobiales bacterium]